MITLSSVEATLPPSKAKAPTFAVAWANRCCMHCTSKRERKEGRKIDGESFTYTTLVSVWVSLYSLFHCAFVRTEITHWTERMRLRSSGKHLLAKILTDLAYFANFEVGNVSE
jgi:hypothetical protein